MAKYEKEFRKYLKNTPTQQGNNLDDNQINILVRILNANLISQISDTYPKIDSLLDVDDMVFLNALKDRLKTGNDLHQFNRNIGNGAPSRALFQYINFLEIESNTLYKGIEKTFKTSSEKSPLNKILYGPPGTGKTYNTIDEALQIIDGYIPEKRSEAKERFEKLSDAGQIEFVTFHQSYGYEEFVEGIKANTVDGSISYDIEDGIFKKLSKKARKNYLDSKKTLNELVKEKTFREKVSLFLNEYFENESEFTKIKGGKFKIIEMLDNKFIIGTDDSKKDLLLKTEDLYKILELDEEIKTSSELGVKYLGYAFPRQKDSYYFAIYKAFKKYKVNKKIEVTNTEVRLNTYILIIDEINRGNISKIFGELITLIEPSKRIGADEEIKLRLPYSNDEFGVPSNLYIIGTMNTADRSIALMDTALRRRFEFVEMMPDYDVLSAEVGVVAEIDIAEMLETINERVEYLYDRDHTIGHAYFMTLGENSSRDNLDHVMRNKIIPLLQEYFYDDWKKILLVLNDGFIEEKKQDTSKIFEKMDEEYIEDDKVSYRVKSTFEKDAYERLCQIK